MLVPDLDEVEDFTPTLHFLSIKDARVSKKVAKNYLNQIKSNAFCKFEELDKVSRCLDNFSEFIRIVDKHDHENEEVKGEQEAAPLA